MTLMILGMAIIAIGTLGAYVRHPVFAFLIPLGMYIALQAPVWSF